MESTHLEAYCVRCKTMIEMVDPEAVWTSRGTPGNRGECPICGGTVFRLGATHLHEGLAKPTNLTPPPTVLRMKPAIPDQAVYINFVEQDEAIARQVADDLNKLGVATWLHEPTPSGSRWAWGMHPALKDCLRMLFLLSPLTEFDPEVTAGWQYFKEKRKPIVILQISRDLEPPAPIRRSPRFDLTQPNDLADYKATLRQVAQALA